MAKKAKKKPRGAGLAKAKPADFLQLHPLSMRITNPQYKALVRLRRVTGLPMQEHVRRAVDFYVASQKRVNVDGVFETRGVS